MYALDFRDERVWNLMTRGRNGNNKAIRIDWSEAHNKRADAEAAKGEAAVQAILLAQEQRATREKYEVWEGVECRWDGRDCSCLSFVAQLTARAGHNARAGQREHVHPANCGVDEALVHLAGCGSMLHSIIMTSKKAAKDRGGEIRSVPSTQVHDWATLSLTRIWGRSLCTLLCIDRAKRGETSLRRISLPEPSHIAYLLLDRISDFSGRGWRV
jgi:hypothetical protein